MVLLQSQMVNLGSQAHAFTLQGVDGKTYTLDSFHDKKILVIVFMCNHCPYVKATINRLVDIQKDYMDKAVQLAGINPNDDKNYPEDSFDNMKILSKEKGLNFPYLRDESQEVAKKYGAVCTPDIFVYGHDRKLFYTGRIDDNWQDESKVTQKDLRKAIDAIVKGQPAIQDQHPSMGCSIKWK